MLDAFAAYANEEVNETLTFEDKEDVYIELIPRKLSLRRRKNGNAI
jgi:hypothetical protein